MQRQPGLAHGFDSASAAAFRGAEHRSDTGLATGSETLPAALSAAYGSTGLLWADKASHVCPTVPTRWEARWPDSPASRFC